MAKTESAFPGFGPETLTFLAQLSNNNRKDWFEANRQRYEDEVREPARAFIRAMGPRLAKVSKNIVASDKKVGGALMRVHRDVRFSKDKTPYKTNVGMHFRHARGKDVHAPGCYVHLGLDGCFLGMGMWHPDGPSLRKIRASIDANPAKWKRVLNGKKLNGVWRHGGESLKRPPKGFDKEHPMLEVLKRKDHILVADLTVEQAESTDLVDLATAHFKAGKAHMKLLCEAIDVAF
ncbi:MAG: DUF2461 domain-containing protein [Sandaracinaceae bacterium]